MFVVALIGLIVLLGLAGAFATATAAGHRQAQSAADLAALAGAGALQQGVDPCGAAADIAGRNKAELRGCVVKGDDVLVDVEVAGPEFLGYGFVAHGSARAGPQ